MRHHRPGRLRAHLLGGARNLDDAQLQRLVTKITGATTLPDRTAVLNRVADQLDAEAWKERAQGFIRSQGLATDGSSASRRFVPRL